MRGNCASNTTGGRENIKQIVGALILHPAIEFGWVNRAGTNHKSTIFGDLLGDGPGDSRGAPVRLFS